MAYNKCHSNIGYENEPSVNTPLSAENQNYTDNCVDILDDRVVALDASKLNISLANSFITNITMNSSNGIFTVTKYDGTTYTIDTKLEKIAVNFSYNASTQKLVITLDDGTTQEVDLSALITDTDFEDSDTIAFSVVDHVASASIKSGSVTDEMLESGFLANCRLAQSGAELAKTAADADALKAEGYSIGKQNGVDVSASSPYYHNNAKYYKEQAQAIAQQSISGLSDVSVTNPQNGQVLTYNSTSAEWENAESAPNKADKVVGATNGNFAGLDSNGNLTDSGKKASNFASAIHSHSKTDITDFPSTMPPSAHTQSASTITSGTFGGDVVVPASTAYSTNQVRNAVLVSTDPGANASVSYANGSIIFVYE